MRAVLIHRYGGPETMQLAERPAPKPGPRDVLIEVRAASLNPIDFKLRDGKSKLALPMAFPIGLGCDVAGVVREVGAEVKRLRPGDEVYARLEKDRMGGLAEQVAADESVVAIKPPSLSFEEAAAVPLAALTALQALREAAGLQAGQRVLVHAGAGGVGSFALQIARILGIWTATTCSGRNVEFVRELGADEVIDYTQADPAATLSGLDAVFDTLGGDSELASARLVKPGGVVVGVSGLPDTEFARAWLPLWVRPILWLLTLRRRWVYARLGVRYHYHFMRPDAGNLDELRGWIEAGKLRPVLHQVFALEDFRAAFAELERGRSRGKIVVRIS